MYGPALVRVVRRSWDDYPGVCQLDIPTGSQFGYFVQCKRVPPNGTPEAIIKLRIRDHDSGYQGWFPFLVDTGAQITVFPRDMLDQSSEDRRAFTAGALWVPVEMRRPRGPGGGVLMGSYFSAAADFQPPASSAAPISIPDFNLFVASNLNIREQPFGLLGQDILQQVITICDREHVTFWSMPGIAPAADLGQ